MPETKQIASLSVVIDSETSYDNIGDIHASIIDETWLKHHIRAHGTHQLLAALASLNYQIIDVQLEIYQEDSKDNLPIQGSGTFPIIADES